MGKRIASLQSKRRNLVGEYKRRRGGSHLLAVRQRREKDQTVTTKTHHNKNKKPDFVYLIQKLGGRIRPFTFSTNGSHKGQGGVGKKWGKKLAALTDDWGGGFKNFLAGLGEEA